MDTVFIENHSQIAVQFGKLDAFFRRVNRHVGGRMIFSASSTLPEDLPVHWRQTSCHVLGNVNYLIRIGLLLELLLLVFYFEMMYLDIELLLTIQTLKSVIMITGVLLLLLSSTSLFANDRAKQTYDLLMVTPIPTDSLLVQSQTTLRRSILLIAALLLTLVGMELTSGLYDLFYWGYVNTVIDNRVVLIVQLFWSAFVLTCIDLMLLRTVLWCGSTIGLRFPNRNWARICGVVSIISIAGISFWCFRHDYWSLLDYLSWQIDFQWLPQSAYLFFIALCGVSEGFRQLCLYKADDWLGRCSGLNAGVEPNSLMKAIRSIWPGLQMPSLPSGQSADGFANSK